VALREIGKLTPRGNYSPARKWYILPDVGYRDELACLTKAKLIRHFWGTFFKNDVKNLSDRCQNIFQIFNCELTYNDYTHNYSYTNPLFTPYNLRFGKGSPPK
jgi:hypothetical protein